MLCHRWRNKLSPYLFGEIWVNFNIKRSERFHLDDFVIGNYCPVSTEKNLFYNWFFFNANEKINLFLTVRYNLDKIDNTRLAKPHTSCDVNPCNSHKMIFQFSWHQSSRLPLRCSGIPNSSVTLVHSHSYVFSLIFSIMSFFVFLRPHRLFFFFFPYTCVSYFQICGLSDGRTLRYNIHPCKVLAIVYYQIFVPTDFYRTSASESPFYSIHYIFPLPIPCPTGSHQG